MVRSLLIKLFCFLGVGFKSSTPYLVLIMLNATLKGPFSSCFFIKKMQLKKHLPYIDKEIWFCDVAQVVNLHKKYLAKFGSIQNMKVEKS
jgi:coproporphyrinogen III oxidase-like Fe-S oxidoreductase